MSTNKYIKQDTTRGLVRSTSVISLGTLASRVLGFVRDILLANYVGTGFAADAFFVAFRIPNLLRDMVGEGAINSSVVPVAAGYAQEKDKRACWEFFSTFLIWAFLVLSVLTLAGMILAPMIVRLIAPGFILDPDKLSLTVQLTRWMFPYLVLIGLTAYGMGILYTLRAFAVPAFSPCLLNMAMIASVLFAQPGSHDIVFYLAIGVLCGGALQLLAQALSLVRHGARFYWPRTLRHEGVQKVGKLMMPRLFGSVVYQLMVFVDTFCASLVSIVGPGGISAIYYANRILQFPLGLFGFALASAILPTLSGFSSRQDMSSFNKTVVFALKNMMMVMFPVSVFFMMFSKDMIRLLFERGEFGAYSTAITSGALCFYALGLCFFAWGKILVTSFHALQDTKTPVKVAGFCLLINIILNFWWMGPLKVSGIALASSASSLVNVVILFRILDQRLKIFSRDLVIFAGKILLASALMAVVSWVSWLSVTFSLGIIKLCVVMLGSFLSFFIFCLIFKVDQAQSVLRWIFKRI